MDLRPGEGRLALLGAVQFFLLMFAYFMLRPLRDAMGVAGGVDRLSTLFLINIGVMVVLNPVYALVAGRVRTRVLTLVVYRAAMVCLGCFALVLFIESGEAPEAVGAVFYVWLSVLNVFMISLFWSLMADLQRPGQSKRIFGVVAVGGTLGAMAGSAWAWGWLEILRPYGMMVCAVVLLEAGARVSMAHDHGGHGGRARERLGGSAWAGLSHLIRSPYLLAIGVYIVMHTSTSTFVYFEKLRVVESAGSTTEARGAVLASVTFYGQLVTVLLQLVLTGRAMRWLGVGSLMAVVPVISVLGFVALDVSTTLAVITVFEVTRNASHYALGKPARETLYTVLPAEDKYKAKAALDTFVYRGGDALSVLVYRAVAPGTAALLWVIVPVGAVGAGVAAWLGRQERRRESETEPDGAGIPGERNTGAEGEPPHRTRGVS